MGLLHKYTQNTSSLNITGMKQRDMAFSHNSKSLSSHTLLKSLLTLFCAPSPRLFFFSRTFYKYLSGYLLGFLAAFSVWFSGTFVPPSLSLSYIHGPLAL